MSMVADLLSCFFAVSGGIFVLVGTVGLWRMPDFPTRAHAASLTDVFGISQMLVAVALQYGLSVVSLKIALVIILLGVTAPVATHAMFRAYDQAFLRR